MSDTKPATIPRDERYTRTVVTPGRSYLCGCDYQRYTALYPTPRVVDEPRCRVHGQPVAKAQN
jgi:hypothetical protein